MLAQVNPEPITIIKWFSHISNESKWKIIYLELWDILIDLSNLWWTLWVIYKCNWLVAVLNNKNSILKQVLNGGIVYFWGSVIDKGNNETFQNVKSTWSIKRHTQGQLMNVSTESHRVLILSSHQVVIF